MGQNVLLSSASDIDFMIHGVLKYELFGQELWITTTHICMFIVLMIIIGFAVIANRAMKKATEVPTGFQNVVELIVELLDGMVKGSMGKNAVKFRNYTGTVFIFILVCNLSGLLGLRPPTADYGVTLPLGILTFVLIHFNQFKYQKPKAIWKDMCSPLPPWLPIWFPINVISEVAVPISLSLRLFANVLSGTVMMALIYGLLKWVALAWPAALHVYFDIFSGAIQTYVFCMLTMTYVNNAIEAGEE
ncbi:MAG: F0F1 ATP synthase subunit A [Lachnospiraceae bacterium]|nr:F0F1 ATP synthase subunit A [Lachnospiraceae bacterium]